MQPLPSSPDSVRAARRQARRFCATHSVDDDRVEATVLVTSELVTNALRHGTPPLAYNIAMDGTDVLVVVQDSDGRAPGDGKASPLSADSGRGLFIVSTVARAWGWTPCADGKHVWARV